MLTGGVPVRFCQANKPKEARVIILCTIGDAGIW